jgi:hypothetical protein
MTDDPSGKLNLFFSSSKRAVHVGWSRGGAAPAIGTKIRVTSQFFIGEGDTREVICEVISDRH